MEGTAGMEYEVGVGVVRFIVANEGLVDYLVPQMLDDKQVDGNNVTL